jgi:hypothetical protein
MGIDVAIVLDGVEEGMRRYIAMSGMEAPEGS